MAVNLTGTWTNSNGKDRDIVEIISIPGGIFIHNHNNKPGQDFENFGFAKMPEYLEINSTFDVSWTDTYSSKGREKGIVHHTKIQVVSPNQLKQIDDSPITPRYPKNKHQTSYGKWKRN